MCNGPLGNRLVLIVDSSKEFRTGPEAEDKSINGFLMCDSLVCAVCDVKYVHTLI